jgi:hypothetical protein
MLTQVAEAALMEKIHKVRTEVMSTGEKTNLGVNVELKRLSAVISTLQVRLYYCFTTVAAGLKRLFAIISTLQVWLYYCFNNARPYILVLLL